MSTPYFPPELSGFERFFIRSASNIKPWMFGIAISLLLPFLQMTVQIPLIQLHLSGWALHYSIMYR
jgi:hypothetical protein